MNIHPIFISLLLLGTAYSAEQNGTKSKKNQQSSASKKPRVDDSAQLKEHAEAIRLANKGKNTEALGIIKKLIDEKKESKNLHSDYAALLIRLGKDKDGLDYYKANIKQENAPLYLSEDIADAYCRQHDYKNARSVYEMILKKDPHNKRAQKGLARCLPVKKTNKILKEHQDAIVLAGAGKTDQALAVLKKLIDENKESKNLKNDYVDLLARSHKDGEAVDYYKSNIKEQEAPLYLLEDIGDAYLRLHDYENARHVYNKILEKNPTNKRAKNGIIRCVEEEKTSLVTNEHDEAMLLVKEGRPKEALVILKKLMNEKKVPQNLMSEYADVMVRAGEDEKAIQYYNKHFKSKDAPIYLMEDIGDAYYRQGSPTNAIKIYEAIIKRDRKNVRAHVGMARCYLGERNPDGALLILKKIEESHGNNLDYWLVKGNALDMKTFNTEAIFCYDQVLKIDPRNKEAIVKRIMSISEAGAPMIALEKADQYPELFDEALMRRIRLTQVGVAVRWGREEAGNNRPYDIRFLKIDNAINMIKGYLSSGQTEEDKIYNQKLRFDLVVAYLYRCQYMKSIEEFEKIRAEVGKLENIPDYVIVGAAQSYQEERMIPQSKELFKYILKKQPKDVTALKGLYYCLLEKEKHAQALEVAEQMKAVSRKFVSYPDFRIVNSERLMGEETYSTAYLYAEYLDRAEDYLENLITTQPFNSDTRKNLSNLYNTRGLSRAAEKQAQLGLAIDPDDLGLKISLANSLLSLQDYKKAEEIIDYLAREYPESKAVQVLLRSWNAYNKRQLDLTAGYDRNYGQVTFSGKREYYVDGKLYSQPILYNYRAFIGSRYAYTRFTEGILNGYFTVVGMDYRGRGLDAAVGFNYNRYGGKKAGYFIRGSVNPTDHWAFAGNIDILTIDNPSRAFVNKITSNVYELGGKYIQNESMSVSVGGRIQHYSDHNTQNTETVRIFKRLFSNYDFKLDSAIDFSTTHSKKINVPYYSPKRDYAPSLEFAINQRLWRDYEYSFRHIVTIAYGRHWEQGHNTRWTGLVSYEHELNYIDWFYVKYGYARKRASYDGAPEYTNLFYLKLNIKF